MRFSTDRLILRDIDIGDADFILELMNSPAYLEFIGDRGVRELAQARDYIELKLRDLYRRFGYGLFLVQTRGSGAPATSVGICGLVRRDSLPGPDLGFAFLPPYWGRGYAFEAAQATLAWAKEALTRAGTALSEIWAVTSPKNTASIRLLSKLGFQPVAQAAAEAMPESLRASLIMSGSL